MRLYLAPSSGLCMLEQESEVRLVDLARMKLVPREGAHLLATHVRWGMASTFANEEEALAKAQSQYREDRAVANLETCLLGVSPALRHELIGEAEDSLKMLGHTSGAAARLLRSPLQQPSRVQDLVAESLKDGFGATAALLERVRGLQPFSNRFESQWLALEPELFGAVPGGREAVLDRAVWEGIVLETLEAPNGRQVEQAWLKLVLASKTAPERIALARIARRVADALYPSAADSRLTDALHLEADRREGGGDSDSSRRSGHSRRARDQFVTALRQVEAIAAAIADGQDARARKYLDELIKAQLAFEGGASFAVKSVCNVAQQCADMYRMDFELSCLESAYAIKPDDAWMWVQFADYYKRRGMYPDALKAIERASQHGAGMVADSARADIWASMGQFEKAMQMYEAIPGWNWDGAIRGARADILRHSGRLQDAMAEYEAMLAEGLGGSRVVSGMAEVARVEGRWADARRMYQELLVGDNELDERSRIIYMISSARIAARMGDLIAAYKELDEVVERRPFAWAARTYRSVVSALLGKPQVAIGDLEKVDQVTGADGWVKMYVHGLLLLMLDRYSDARSTLLKLVAADFADADAQGMLRMGAAVCFLKSKAGVEDAAHMLEGAPKTTDGLGVAIRAAVWYHVAVVRKDAAAIARLKAELAETRDTDIREIVIALDRRDWASAWAIEVKSLMRLVA